MRPSIVVRVSVPSTLLLSVFALFFSAILTSAQSVGATNNTLPGRETKSAFVLRLNDASFFDEKSYVVVPLTVAAGKGQSTVALSTYHIQGIFKYGNLTTNLTDSDLAFLACDSLDPTQNASDLVAKAAAKNPQAIVLYSVISEACTHSGDFGYQSIYSMTSRQVAQELLSTTALRPISAPPLRASITPSSSDNAATPVMDTNSEGGPAPTTAVAMSILYSITGVITLLFLIIIATGAIRAHRHPERYGPRHTAFPGRPRQSRAKGLARAMLDTIPIVKYEDPAPIKDMSDPNWKENQSHSNLGNVHVTEIDMEQGKNEGVGPIFKSSIETNHDASGADLGCSICTEDFVPGEDLRVLPCNHKYHPVCIDPWLLDVCGTCPLCRHDLRPVISNTHDNGTVSGASPPPLSAIRESSGDPELSSRRNPIARFFDLNRLRQAQPSESISALRQLRQQTQAEAALAGIEGIEERSSSSSLLTKKLKDVFRIKTRTQQATPSISV